MILVTNDVFLLIDKKFGNERDTDHRKYINDRCNKVY